MTTQRKSTYTIAVFLKFGREQDIADLFNNGTIYINSIQYFRNIEDGKLRGDQYEGVSDIINSLPGQFEVLGKTIPYERLHLPKAFETVYGNIYSLYCVSSYGFPSPEDVIIDTRVRNFGSHLIIINQPGEFLKRIQRSLDLAGLKYHHGFVDYYDRFAINRKVTLFEKPKEYEYQKEFRIYVKRDQITPLVIKIGSLKDIATVHPSSVVTELTFRNAVPVE